MADDYDFLVALHHYGGLPENDVVNTLHFTIDSPDSPVGVADEVAAGYVAFAGNLSGAVSGMTIKGYKAGPNPAGPDFSKNYAITGGGQASVAEVCCCLSYATVDDPERSVPRGRGRLYIGPLGGSKLMEERPHTTLREAIIALGQAFASAGFAGNTTWKMKSVRDNAYRKIESIWVDDAWDIQRRRGLAPSARTVADVQ